MTIYYSLTFLLLAAEMVTFMVLVLPLPHVMRKKIFGFMSESPVIAKLAYGLKIAFIFVFILFVDAVQRMWRVTAEAEKAKQGITGANAAGIETNFAARKFYAQRNTYLTGFCLFLSFVLTRTFYISLDLIHAENEYKKVDAEKKKLEAELIEIKSSDPNAKTTDLPEKTTPMVTRQRKAAAAASKSE